MLNGILEKIIGVLVAVLTLTTFNPQDIAIREITELNLSAVQDGDCANDTLICQLHFNGKITLNKKPASDTVSVNLYISRKYIETRLFPTNKNGEFNFDWNANLRTGIHKFVVCPNGQLTKCKIRDIFGA